MPLTERSRLYDFCIDAIPTLNLNQLLALTLVVLDQIYEHPLVLEVEVSTLTIKVKDLQGSRLGYMQMERRGFPRWYAAQPGLFDGIACNVASPQEARNEPEDQTTPN